MQSLIGFFRNHALFVGYFLVRPNLLLPSNVYKLAMPWRTQVVYIKKPGYAYLPLILPAAIMISHASGKTEAASWTPESIHLIR